MKGFPIVPWSMCIVYKMHKFNRHSGCPNFVFFFPLLKYCLNLGTLIQFRNLFPILEHCLIYETLFGPCPISLVWSKFFNIESILENCQYSENSKSDTILRKAQILELCPKFWNFVPILDFDLIVETCPNYGTLSQ